MKRKRWLCLLCLSLLLPVLASCGAGMEAESETVSSYVPKARDYKIERIDGEDYLVFDDEAYEYYKNYKNSGSSLMTLIVAGMTFYSAQDFRDSLRIGDFNKFHAFKAVTKENGRFPLGNFERLLVLYAPEGFVTEEYRWLGRDYEHKMVRPADGAIVWGCFFFREETFDQVLQHQYVDRYEGEQSEPLSERNATLIRLENETVVRYTLTEEGRTVYVSEIRRNDSEWVQIDLYAKEPEKSFYYHVSVELPNRTDELIDEEWLLSIGVQLAP